MAEAIPIEPRFGGLWHDLPPPEILLCCSISCGTTRTVKRPRILVFPPHSNEPPARCIGTLHVSEIVLGGNDEMTTGRMSLWGHSRSGRADSGSGRARHAPIATEFCCCNISRCANETLSLLLSARKQAMKILVAPLLANASLSKSIEDVVVLSTKLRIARTCVARRMGRAQRNPSRHRLCMMGIAKSSTQESSPRGCEQRRHIP